MSEAEEKADSLKNPCDEMTASHFALQIALQTMKERCQLLQQRLSAVEEENLRFRIENQNNSRNNNERVPASQLMLLEEKITQLTRQKSQLNDHFLMVLKENTQLWTRLSRLTEANRSLGNHLSKISDTLSKHPPGTISASKLDELCSDTKALDCNDAKEESLEEISLKIIDTIRQEKKVLEQQCEEMVEIQIGAVRVEDCGFTLTTNEKIASGVTEEDTENTEDVMEDIKVLRDKMKEEHKLLKSQQAGLQAAISSINIMLSDKKCCKCKGKNSTEDDKIVNKTLEPQHGLAMSTLKSPLEEIQNQLKDVSEPPDLTESDGSSLLREQDIFNNKMENNQYDANKNFDDRICPLCSKFYSQKVPFEEFHEHVLSHFHNENDEPESLVANFEVIT